MWTVRTKGSAGPEIRRLSAEGHLAQIQWIFHTVCVRTADENTAKSVWQQPGDKGLSWLKKSVRVGFNSQPSRSKNAASKKERTSVQFQIQYANQLYNLAEKNSGKEQDCVGLVPGKNQSDLNNIDLYQSHRFKLLTWKLSKSRTLHANKITEKKKKTCA